SAISFITFCDNSAKLSKSAQKQLSKIIPLYAEALFSEAGVKEKVASFNVEGHASPSFLGKYVDPLSDQPTPYNYNLNLSARRAASITNYVFGRQIKKYPYKFYMRSLTRSIGHGYNKPVEKNVMRSIASFEPKDYVTKDNCGQYDCALSQRVELSFTLKEDPKTLEKIIQYKAGDL
ncbi:MAG: hypothetical protein WEB87_00525, partial [Bacteriovoracaceae bacterium]